MLSGHHTVYRAVLFERPRIYCAVCSFGSKDCAVLSGLPGVYCSAPVSRRELVVGMGGGVAGGSGGRVRRVTGGSGGVA